MRRVVGALKATYKFFSGDAIVLSMVIVAFVVAYALERFLAGNQLVAGAVFVALILLGITLTLGRERASARRKQRAARGA
jgi:predicted lysophospholipase L1 biosynthesis ABC-type transport system permease subunit